MSKTNNQNLHLLLPRRKVQNSLIGILTCDGGVNWVPFKDIAPPPPPPPMNRGRGDRGRRRDGAIGANRSSLGYRTGPADRGARRGRGRGGYGRGGTPNFAVDPTVPYVNYMPYMVPLEGQELNDAILKQM